MSIIQRGWKSLWSTEEPSLPYRIQCSCEQILTGFRQAKHQVLHCPGCQEPRFILPRSPLPPLVGQDVNAGKHAKPLKSSPWIVPCLAAGVTLAAVIVLYLLLFYALRDSPIGPVPDRPSPRKLTFEQTIEEKMQTGRQLLAEGNFREAHKHLQEAYERDRDNPELAQLHRQAHLLATLLRDSLEEIVQQGQMVRKEEEWQAQFLDYKGKAVFFDDRIRRDANDRPALTFHEVVYETIPQDDRVEIRTARINLDLDLFKSIDLTQSPRLIFGARLERVARGEGGIWMVEFDPKSGVLLTDEGAAAACGLAPLDTELRRVLQHQRGLVEGLPVRPPPKK